MIILKFEFSRYRSNVVTGLFVEFMIWKIVLFVKLSSCVRRTSLCIMLTIGTHGIIVFVISISTWYRGVLILK